MGEAEAKFNWLLKFRISICRCNEHRGLFVFVLKLMRLSYFTLLYFTTYLTCTAVLLILNDILWGSLKSSTNWLDLILFFQFCFHASSMSLVPNVHTVLRVG